MLDHQLIKKVNEKLLKYQLTVSTAESISAGRLAAAFTEFSGASNFFNSAIVTYNDFQKEQLLGVKKETLNQYGAISRQTAFEMANGVRIKTGSNIAISLTGNAGPNPHEHKEVGLTFIAIIINGHTTNYMFQSKKTSRIAIINDTIDFVFKKLDGLIF